MTFPGEKWSDKNGPFTSNKHYNRNNRQLKKEILGRYALSKAPNQRHDSGVVVQLPHRRVLLLGPGAEVVLGDHLVPHLLVVLLENFPQPRD